MSDRNERTDWPDRALAVVFGDRRGLALFLGALVFAGLYWRVRHFSTDQFAVLNALVALADGHLAIHDPVYGSAVSPGTYVADGNLYGRNYGHVVVALPVLFALRGLALVFDLQALLIGAWGLTFLGFAVVVGRLVDRRRLALRVASPVALGLFLGNVLVGEPLAERWVPLVALQVPTALAAALLAVMLYRLVARRHDVRLGVAAGAAAVLATPVGFWATVPKRHSFSALLVVCCLYALYRSREAGNVAGATRFRALAYGLVGLATWIHAGEALVLFVALAVVDVPTARSNRPRHLALVGGAFVASLIPFLLTNALVSGDPFLPPRLLPAADSVDAGALSGGSAGSSATSTATAENTAATAGNVTPTAGNAPTPTPASGGAGDAGIIARIAATVAPVGTAVNRFRTLVLAGMEAGVRNPGRLVHTFVRSGYASGLRTGEDVAVNLSVLEAMPLLGALIAGPLAVAGRIRIRLATQDGRLPVFPTAWFDDRSNVAIRDRLRLSPARTAEAFVVVYALLLIGVMLRRFPLHHMLTVRYLHPIYPLGLFSLVGLPTVRRVVDRRSRVLVGSYGGTVAIGTPVYVAFLTLGNPVLGEAVQAFALVALTAAVAVAAWAAFAAAAGRSHARAGAILLGVAAGLVTTYLLVSGLALFSVERAFLLPWSETLAEWIGFGASGVGG